ncbi:MAG: glutamate racemase [Prevotellaceae bacterium]|jgi:glutamate racemase|nr:glutamate racemase [Prevotellaceae bacterium]
MYDAPIGFFDSGVGGLSVWREVTQLLPYENTVYYADTAFCPYGTKTPAEIVTRADYMVDFLLSKRSKLIVVACNTATAAAIDHLRSVYAVPFVAMEPAVKPAALHSKSNVVGVLATRGTFKGRLYHETLSRFASHVTIIEQPGDGLVEAVEAGNTDSPEIYRLLETYLRPMLDAGADHIVLGCTHYPFLIPAIKTITGNRVCLIDPAPAVAQRVKELLAQHGLLNHSTRKAQFDFFSSGDRTQVEKFAEKYIF